MPEIELEGKTDQETMLVDLVFEWQVLLNCDSLKSLSVTHLFNYYGQGTLLFREDKAHEPHGSPQINAGGKQ